MDELGSNWFSYYSGMAQGLKTRVGGSRKLFCPGTKGQRDIPFLRNPTLNSFPAAKIFLIYLFAYIWTTTKYLVIWIVEYLKKKSPVYQRNCLLQVPPRLESFTFFSHFRDEKISGKWKSSQGFSSLLRPCISLICQNSRSCMHDSIQDWFNQHLFSLF